MEREDGRRGEEKTKEKERVNRNGAGDIPLDRIPFPFTATVQP